ncbi:adenylate kinase 9 isoform X1 [Lepisosteus oculatus]|uniref:adenylate kinase 9 isoform X1 n=1 Tax=Lepisosteus oculatus TaxID=7918 RepID=UPI0035F506DC
MEPTEPTEVSESNPFVDCLNEDESEREFLQAKPTCFIIIGKPGVGKSTLAKRLSQTWKSILIDDTELINHHITTQTDHGLKFLEILHGGKSIPEEMVTEIILEKLKSPEVEHYGYVLSSLPSTSEEYLKIPEQIEMIKNLNLVPDFIINIKCPDYDLSRRLSGQRQHPETGKVYQKEQWDPVKKDRKRRKRVGEEEGEEEEEEEEEENVQAAEEGEEGQFQKDMHSQLVTRPEDFPDNTLKRIALYKDTMLRPLEDYMADHDLQYLFELDGNKSPTELYVSVMSRLETMAVRSAAVPIRLLQLEEEELPEEIDNEELLRTLSSSKMVAPGYRWRRSRWGRACPVALKQGNVIMGKPEFSVGFLDKIYVLSSQEALQSFMVNPRPYLLPPMPRAPCKVAVIGPPSSGKTTLCRLLAGKYSAKVIDMETLVQPVVAEERKLILAKVREEAVASAIEYVKIRVQQEVLNRDGEDTTKAAPDEEREFNGNGFEPGLPASPTEKNMEVDSASLPVEVEEAAPVMSEGQPETTTASSSEKGANEVLEVTAEHPEVQALVSEAVKKSEQNPITLSPEVYVDILEKHIKQRQLDTENQTARGWVLDNFPRNRDQLIFMQEREIIPDMFICIRDSEEDGKHLLTRIYESHKEEINSAVLERFQKEQRLKERKALQELQESGVELEQPRLEAVLEEPEAAETPDNSQLNTFQNTQDTQSQLEEDTLHTSSEQTPKVIQEMKGITLPSVWEKGFPEGPEMELFREQMKLFVQDWEAMETSITPSSICLLEIAGKTPESLLSEAVYDMEKPFKYIAWELSGVDLDEEEEDAQAVAETEEAEELGEEEVGEEETRLPKRQLGDTKHFCAVSLKEKNVLIPCTDECAAKYREKAYYFSSPEAREKFLLRPEMYVSHTKLLQAPPLRVFLLGARGSGKTTQGRWLASKLGIFHIQFREQLQEMIIKKTRKRILLADEVEPEEETPEDVEALLAAEGQNELPETQTAGSGKESPVGMPVEVTLTDEEEAIKSYLSDGNPLPQEILDMILPQWWEEEPFRSTGFILEGFPQNPEEVQYLAEQSFFSDAAVIMTLEVTDIVQRLLPPRLARWREKRDRKMELQRRVREIKNKMREEGIAKRRGELLAEQAEKQAAKRAKQDEEGGSEGEMEEEEEEEDEIEALLLEEFPQEDEEDAEEEQEFNAVERLEVEIGERFETDTTNLQKLQDLLSDLHIPQISINAGRKSRIVHFQLFERLKSLVENREGLFEKCYPLSFTQARKLLRLSYKFSSAFGCWDPVRLGEGDVIQPIQGPNNPTYPVLYHQFIYFFASKDSRNKFMLNPIKYLRQPKPKPSLPIKIAVVGPPKSGKSTVAKMFANEYGLQQLSVGEAMRLVLSSQKQTELAFQMNKYLTKGQTVPDELAIQCVEVALMDLVCSTRGFVLDGYPMTKKQADLMEARSIIPVRVLELQVDTKEVLRRGLMDKINTVRSYPLHDSPQILTIRNSIYKREVEAVRQYYQQHYQNWVVIDGHRSKWWVWNKMLEESRMSVKHIQNYLERIRQGKAARIDRLCITPQELQSRLGEFGHYCPVSLAKHRELVDCAVSASLEFAAEFRGHYYKMASKECLEIFLETPEQFVIPLAPHPLPPPHMLPKKLTAAEVKAKFPRQAEMRGYCPVSYLDGKQRYEALVPGNIEHSVEYRGKIFIFEDEEKLQKFMRLPETYWNQTLPNKLPPKKEPVLLTSLPLLGYLEQGTATTVIKALTAVGCLKPKYPFLSVRKSALLYVACHLKAYNPRNSDYIRKKYKKKLEKFEESCELIPYLGSQMTQRYKEPQERPIDFDHKLHTFLALKGTEPTSTWIL